MMTITLERQEEKLKSDNRALSMVSISLKYLSCDNI